MIDSLSDMILHYLEFSAGADWLEAAFDGLRRRERLTRDLGGTATADEFTEAVAGALAKQ